MPHIPQSQDQLLIKSILLCKVHIYTLYMWPGCVANGATGQKGCMELDQHMQTV